MKNIFKKFIVGVEMKTKKLSLFLYFMALSLGIVSQTLAQEQMTSQEAWKVKKELENEEKRVEKEWKEQGALLKKD